MRLDPTYLFTPAKVTWFGKPDNDAKYLDLWRDVPAAEGVPDDPDEFQYSGWHTDEYRRVLAVNDHNHAIFAYAADLLLRYKFYPPEMIYSTSDFGIEDRHMRPGDRIVQRIPVWHMGDVRVVDVLAMNVVLDVIDEPNRIGFVVATTQEHSERGVWKSWVQCYDNGMLTLNIRAVARPAHRERRFMHPYMRYRQLKAHKVGIEQFMQRVCDEAGAVPLQ